MKTFNKSKAKPRPGELFVGEGSPLAGRSDVRKRRAESIEKKVKAEQARAAKKKK